MILLPTEVMFIILQYTIVWLQAADFLVYYNMIQLPAGTISIIPQSTILRLPGADLCSILGPVVRAGLTSCGACVRCSARSPSHIFVELYLLLNYSSKSSNLNKFVVR